MSEEIKSLIEEGNKTIASIRSEVDALKKRVDPLDEQKLSRMETDLAANIAARQAEEAKSAALAKRLEELELKEGRPGLTGAPTKG